MTWKLNPVRSPMSPIASELVLVFQRDHGSENADVHKATDEKLLATLEFQETSDAYKALQQTQQRWQAAKDRLAETGKALAEATTKWERMVTGGDIAADKQRGIVDGQAKAREVHSRELELVTRQFVSDRQAAVIAFQVFKREEGQKATATAQAKEKEALRKLNEVIPPILEAWSAARHKQLTGNWPSDADLFGHDPSPDRPLPQVPQRTLQEINFPGMQPCSTEATHKEPVTQ